MVCWSGTGHVNRSAFRLPIHFETNLVLLVLHIAEANTGVHERLTQTRELRRRAVVARKDDRAECLADQWQWQMEVSAMFVLFGTVFIPMSL